MSISIVTGRNCLAIFFFIALLFMFDSAQAAELVIHMSPKGNDQSDGLSKNSAVASLQVAIDKALASPKNRYSQLRVMVAKGEYTSQYVVLNNKLDGRPLSIMGDGNQKQVSVMGNGGQRPVFNGYGKGGTWLSIKAGSIAETKCKVSGLEITNYVTAISIQSDRNVKGHFAGKNEITNNIFRNIGQIAAPGAKPSTAVIRLVNSDNNLISGNKFINLRNIVQCPSLHAIYAAHDSTRNVISNNVFQDSCGDAIRFRDESHSNIVKNNTFIDAWDKSPVSDWYCDKSKTTSCTKASGECPSLNNVLEGNTVRSKSGKAPKIFIRRGYDETVHCPKKASDQRVIIR
jgi:parallel beta-helix repeat protein